MVEKLMEETAPAVRLSGQGTTKGERTRTRILDVAYDSIVHKGFAATSIDELVEAAGITKSGFFYHFKDKGELAEAMMERYLVQDKAVLDEIFKRADELNDDPLHGLLVALKLFAEMLGNLPEAHPGCLAASFCYQDQLFNKKIRDMNADGLLRWRKRFRERLDKIAEKYTPRGPVDLEALSDMAASNVEGGLILGRVLKDVTILPRQIMLFRDLVRTTFLPEGK